MSYKSRQELLETSRLLLAAHVASALGAEEGDPVDRALSVARKLHDAIDKTATDASMTRQELKKLKAILEYVWILLEKGDVEMARSEVKGALAFMRC